MKNWYEIYKTTIVKTISREDVAKTIRIAAQKFVEAKKQALRQIKNLEELLRRAKEIRRDAINNLESLIKEVKEHVEAVGGTFYLAKTAGDANRKVLEICEKHEAKTIVKSKSTTTEEISLNEFLEEHDVEVVETDLGEYIIQQLKEKPSHFVVPAVHISKEKIAELFSKLLGEKIPPEITAITLAARKILRRKFITADIGISGANAIAADTGTIFLITNEGNGRFVTNAPPIHICITGIEKINPTIEDAFTITRILPIYATGQIMTSYVSLITGPSRTADIEFTPTIGVHGPKELHLILLDNGRTKMLKDPSFKDALQCIRCGSCLNVCPVYQRLGGTYGYKYIGAIGTIFTAFMHGIEKAAGPAYACTLCSKCVEACPLGLDIPKMMTRLRNRLQKMGYTTPPHQKVLANIFQTGNPFGEPKETRTTWMKPRPSGKSDIIKV